MKLLYLDCAMGAAGDMLSAALLELVSDKEAALSAINAAGIPGVSVRMEKSEKCGIVGTHLHVEVNGREEHEHSHGFGLFRHKHSHSHRTMADIHTLLDGLNLPDSVKEHAKAVYDLVFDAECRVHGGEKGHVHLHEVGAMDAVADVCFVSLLLDMLKPDIIAASPIHVGSGTVRCAHGVLPVPAPATALLLEGLPIYSGSIKGELCTPTGAALLRHFVQKWGDMPLLNTKAIGYGMGTKDFEQANCLRVFWGESAGAEDTVWELCCNLDDMTAEAVAFAQEQLMAAGALDAYTVPIGMKKGRQGLQLWCMCREEQLETMKSLLFRHTSTWGMRVSRSRRFVLARQTETVETPHGPIRIKYAEFDGVRKAKAEYEDLSRIARETGMSLAEVKTLVQDKL